MFSGNQAAQPDYDLSFGLVLTEDRFEPNGAVAEAFALLTGDQRHDDLSLHTDSDEDWYRWSATESGTLRVTALFSQMLGDVDLELFDSEGRRLVSSVSTTDDESLQWDVQQDATYLVRVRSTGGEANPSYTLIIDGPGTVPRDTLEPNNDVSSATVLESSQTETSMASIHDAEDEDWYRWIAPATGVWNVQLLLASPIGDLQVELFDDDGQLVARGEDAVSHPVTGGEAYSVRVSGVDGATHPGYSLSTRIEYDADRFEPNNRFSTAFDLVTGDQNYRDLSLHHGHDEDWFRWTSPADGNLLVRADFDESLGDMRIELIDDFGTLLAVSSGESRATIGDFLFSLVKTSSFGC